MFYQRFLKMGPKRVNSRDRKAVSALKGDGVGIDSRKAFLKSDFLYQVGESQYHLAMTLSPFAPFHGSRPGPFEGIGNSIVAPWAPDNSKNNAIEVDKNSLLSPLPDIRC